MGKCLLAYDACGFCKVLGVKLADNRRHIISLSPAATETLSNWDRKCCIPAFCVRPADVKGRQILESYGEVELVRLSEVIQSLS